MPFNEALFWFGITAFGTGLYFLFEATVKRLYSIGVTAIGALACAYSVYRHYHPESPAIQLWVILLVVTWALLGYNIYFYKFRHLPPLEKKKLRIRSAFYGTGSLDEREVTEKLSMAATDALVVPVDNNFLGCDPAPMKMKRLRVEYSYGNLSILQATRWEGGRLVLPEDSEIQRLMSVIQQLESSQPKQSAYPIPDLRLKVLEMCSELQGFLGMHGQEPEVVKQPSETDADFLRRYIVVVTPWRAKVLGDYRLKFGDSVPRLRDEIRVRTGKDNFVLNNFIETAAHNPNGNIKEVEGIVKTFWDMALEINT